MVKIVYYFRPTSLKHILRKLPRSYKVVPIDREVPKDFKLELPAVLIADSAQDDIRRLARMAPRGGHWRAVSLLKGDTPSRSRSKEDIHVFSNLPQHVSHSVLESTVQKAFDHLRSEIRHEHTRQELHLAVAELETVNKIGVALSTERNTDALLELILTKSREITGCDAGSLYLAEEEHGGGKHLVFKLTQSDSHSVPFRQFTLPIDTKSIAGYAAATGEILNIKDAYRITKLPFRLNRDFDQKFGYRTKSMLVMPMKNQKDEVIGVLQFINAKRDPAVKLTSPKLVHREVIQFSQRSQDLASSLASQAAVALENNLLYRDIQRLFEGFVKASVTAIESRDPTTFGHSERVAALTVGLAEAVDRSDSGPYKAINFSRQEIQELRYASLLHDFGKVGVREDVLVKAKKLYPSQLDLIKKRFLYVKKAVELESLRKKVNYLVENGNHNYLETFGKMDVDFQSEAARLEEFLQAILQANEPTVLPEKSSEKLLEIAGWTFDDPSGQAEPLLAPEELRFLSIPKGSLDPDERMQIESHVIHSYRFLSQIPWTKELKNIPNIAKAHHEKLDGSGYPYHMKSEDIPFQSKMMTISDIYDALTARDRPYKRAVPIERALDIIGQEVKSQLLDPVLFHLFVEAKIFQLTAKD
jgi:HD-GYP domain-containing protein (c-di-GMP phosphodiesterase class II)